MTNTDVKIGDFEIVDHGIMYSDYFQGCGVAYTDFSQVVTGIGNSPAEAGQDCLEQIASMGYDADDLEAQIVADRGGHWLPTEPSVLGVVGEDAHDCYYYVSIRFREG